MNILYQAESDLSSAFLMQSLGIHEIEMGRLDPSLSNAIGDLWLTEIYLKLCL